MREEYANGIVGIYQTKTVRHPENGEDYVFHLTTTLSCFKDNEMVGTVNIYVYRAANVACLGSYRMEKMPAFSCIGLIYGHAQGLSNWLLGNNAEYLIRRAQYALKHQAGPMVLVNGKGQLDGPLLHDQMGVYYEAS